MKLRPTSLRGRLVWPLSVLLVFLLLLSIVSSYRNARSASDSAYDRTLLAAARMISERLTTSDGKVQLDVAFVALDSFAFDASGRIFYQASGPDRKWISGFTSMPGPPPDLAITYEYPALARFYDAEYRGLPVRMVSLLQPLPIDSNPGGMVEIRVGETLQARERLARGLLQEVYWKQALLVVISCLLLAFAVSGALRPVERLRESVAARRLDDLRPVDTDELPRELQPLATAINYWSGRLRTLFDRQERFIADASHQLRTPLSVLKSNIELALRSQDIGSMRSSIEAAHIGCDRMIAMSNRLLTTARVRGGTSALIEGLGTNVDIGTTIRDIAIALAPLAHQKRIALSLDVVDPLIVWGDKVLLQELFANLVDNAICHTPTGGKISLRVLPRRIVEIEDSGPGIPVELRERVFQPFFSGEKAGTGLGLSIALEIAEAHAATIVLAEAKESPSGLRVQIHFHDLPSLRPTDA